MQPFASTFYVLSLSNLVSIGHSYCLLSWHCLGNVPVISEAYPQVSTYSFCFLYHDLFWTDGFRKALQRLSKIVIHTLANSLSLRNSWTQWSCVNWPRFWVGVLLLQWKIFQGCCARRINSESVSYQSKSKIWTKTRLEDETYLNNWIQ